MWNLNCYFFSLFKGDIINVIRQVDENWCEGKLRGKLGIFPVTFVEVRMMAHIMNENGIESPVNRLVIKYAGTTSAP